MRHLNNGTDRRHSKSSCDQSSPARRTITYSIIRQQHDDVIKWKHFPRYWPFVRGIHRSPLNSPHKGQWHGALMVSLICVWINDWVNNREAGDLRRYRAHYNVIVMISWCTLMYILNVINPLIGPSVPSINLISGHVTCPLCFHHQWPGPMPFVKDFLLEQSRAVARAAQHINTLSLGWNGCDFAEEIFKCISCVIKFTFYVKIAVFWFKFHWIIFIKGEGRGGGQLIQPSLVQIMASHRSGGKPLSESMIA